MERRDNGKVDNGKLIKKGDLVLTLGVLRKARQLWQEEDGRL